METVKLDSRVLTSQVKKGDVFSRGNYLEVAESDAYVNPKTGCWSVDLRGGYIYGWEQQDNEIAVNRTSSVVCHKNLDKQIQSYIKDLQWNIKIGRQKSLKSRIDQLHEMAKDLERETEDDYSVGQ